MTEPADASSNPWVSHSMVIDEITPEFEGVATYKFRFRNSESHERYRFRPGQFNMLYLPGVGEIAISLSAGSPLTTWDHTIRVAGNVTRKLPQLGVNDSLGLRGPFGTYWPIDDHHGSNIILVAGGIGLAPLRPVIHELLKTPNAFGTKTLLFGTRSPRGLLYQNEYAAWLAAGIDVQVTVDRSAPGWTGNVGVVPLLLDGLQSWSPDNTVLFVCGPEVMMRYTVRSALARGLRKDQIWVSLERNMQCAVGLCGHCQLGPAFVCKDGPVFRFDRIEPFLCVDAL